jgi:hypothetical protein
VTAPRVEIEAALASAYDAPRRIERVDRDSGEIDYEVYIDALAEGAGDTQPTYPWVAFRAMHMKRVKAEATLYANAPTWLRQLLADLAARDALLREAWDLMPDTGSELWEQIRAALDEGGAS